MVAEDFLGQAHPCTRTQRSPLRRPVTVLHAVYVSYVYSKTKVRLLYALAARSVQRPFGSI